MEAQRDITLSCILFAFDLAPSPFCWLNSSSRLGLIDYIGMAVRTRLMRSTRCYCAVFRFTQTTAASGQSQLRQPYWTDNYLEWIFPTLLGKSNMPTGSDWSMEEWPFIDTQKSSTFNLPVPTKKPREIHWFGINWRANIFAYCRSVLNESRVTLWFPLLIQIHSPLSVYPGTKTIRAINLADLLATTTTRHEEERIHKMLSLSFSTSILFSCRNSDAFASARVMWCIFNAVAPSFVSLPSLSWLISIWL